MNDISSLAKALINPIRQVLDYESFARKCLPITPLGMVDEIEVLQSDPDILTELGIDPEIFA